MLIIQKNAEILLLNNFHGGFRVAYILWELITISSLTVDIFGYSCRRIEYQQMTQCLYSLSAKYNILIQKTIDIGLYICKKLQALWWPYHEHWVWPYTNKQQQRRVSPSSQSIYIHVYIEMPGPIPAREVILFLSSFHRIKIANQIIIPESRLDGSEFFRILFDLESFTQLSF